MTRPAGSILHVTGALIGDTFAEARARWLFWGLFGLSTLLILIFLFALNIDLTQGAAASMDGGANDPASQMIRRFVYQSYSWVSVFVYIWGTLLAVFASAGLVPSVLEAGRISLLLSKPVSRTTLLMGRYAGNLLVVAANHVYLICAIWIIIGLKTGIWERRFLLAIPAALFIFAVLLTMVVFIGVVAESAALAVMAAVALMLVSTILAQREIVMRLLSSDWSRQLWRALYWVLPKVYDLGDAMRQTILFDRNVNWWTPVWTSSLFALLVLSSAILIFRRRDF